MNPEIKTTRRQRRNIRKHFSYTDKHNKHTPVRIEGKYLFGGINLTANQLQAFAK